MIYAYTRVSTQEQICSRQEDAINGYCEKNGITVDEWFSDKISGKTFVRDNYLAMKNKLEKGDTIIIKEIDRLSRDYDGIKEEWRWFMDHDINVIVVSMPLLSSGLGEKSGSLDKRFLANIIFELLSYLAAKEREKISERTKEGLASAAARGVKLGRPCENDHERDLLLVAESMEAGENYRDFCARTGIKQTRYYDLRNEVRERAKGICEKKSTSKDDKSVVVKMYEAGVRRPSEIAERTGIPRARVYNILETIAVERDRSGYKLNSKDRAIITHYRAGVPVAAIAREFDVTPAWIRKIIKRHSDKY